MYSYPFVIFIQRNKFFMRILDVVTNKFITIILKEKDKFIAGMCKFFENTKQEGRETKEAFQYMQKYMRGEKLTAEENDAFKTQTGDVLKGLGIIVPFALIPGASISIPVLIKLCDKFGIDYTSVLPSAFKDGRTK